MKPSPRTEPTETIPSRAPGRPRRPDVDDAVLQAAIELLTERGLEGTTMNAVIARSGVSRMTVYLRWPNRPALIAAAVREAMSRPPLEMSGDLEADVRRGVEHVRAILSSPGFRGILPAFVSGVTSQEGDERLSYDAVIPGRAVLAEEYRTHAAASRVRDDVRPELVVDLIIGGLLNHSLATGSAPTKEEADEIVSVILDGVRRAPPLDAENAPP
jgi:AcrR family transcriptional regulator